MLEYTTKVIHREEKKLTAICDCHNQEQTGYIGLAFADVDGEPGFIVGICQKGVPEMHVIDAAALSDFGIQKVKGTSHLVLGKLVTVVNLPSQPSDEKA